MTLQWWQRAVFYQVYPRSFADSDGDGIGDLRGLIEKLDYLVWLGVDALWLSPHFPSPQVDIGYDVADFTDVNPEYGTLEDFRALIAEAHARNIRVILDFVLNHTSDQHPWFIESRRTVDSPRRDWYIWREGKGGAPPNNWESTFGGSAWEQDALTGQYYYHYFFKEQPDLNWRNPDVKNAMFDAVRFWYDLGVDGFRLDAISTLFEQPDLPDHDAPFTYTDLHRAFGGDLQAQEASRLMVEQLFRHQRDQPGVHELFQELRRVNDEYPERLLVGETDLIEYHGEGDNELHMVFNFPLMRSAPLTPARIRENQAERLAELPPGAWACNTLGNHDTARVHSYFGDGAHDDARARLSFALMLTLRGTPFLYNGEEIGMRDLLLDDVARFRDMLGVWRYNLEREVLGTPHDRAVRIAAAYGRDKCRTPMQWSGAPNGGFCSADVTPWLPVHPNHADGVNVQAQLADPDSLLHFYHALIHLRRAAPALIEGEYRPLHEEAEDYFAFLRETESQRVLVVLNFSNAAQDLAFDLPALKVLYSSSEKTGTLDTTFTLDAWEIVIAEIVLP